MIAPSSKRERKGERVMSVQPSEFGQDARMEVNTSVASTVRAGVLGGLAGGVSIWIYEAIVWVGVQRMIPLDQIPRSAIGPVLGRAARDSPGALAYILGTGMHFFLCFAWGVLFAFLWPYFRQRGYEATLVGLFFAVFLWIVAHSAIALISSDHSNFLDPNVVIGGIMAHFFYTVPLALVVKRLMSGTAG